jgi:phosphopantothenoylcysteine decarboxylase
MPNILLGVTGSVAAIRTPSLFTALRVRGNAVKVVATKAATYFFDPAAIASLPGGGRDPSVMVLDEDEWPGRDQGRRYERSDDVLHIELRRWADLFLIAPLDANTLAKFVAGICDNCLTCVWRAWDPERPVVLAPAMNTMMWQHPLTHRHLRTLAADMGTVLPLTRDQDVAVPLINLRCEKLQVVPPISKELACGDVGVGAMAEVNTIVDAVQRMMAKSNAK